MQESLESIKAEFEERLRFERLLSDLSSMFVNIPPDRVDPEINRALKEVLEFFQVDRVGLLQVFPSESSFRITHVASAEDMPPVPVGVEVPQSLYPWSYNKVARERVGAIYEIQTGRVRFLETTETASHTSRPR